MELKEHIPEAIHVAGGYLMPSLHRPKVWVFISKTGIESELKVSKQIIWRDYNLTFQQRQAIRAVIARDAHHLMKEQQEVTSSAMPAGVKVSCRKV